MDKLRAMEYLVRVVEAGSFAEAARELDVSPPAVTKMIAALEHELGTALLRRGGRRLTLTPEGMQYYRVSARTVADLHAAEDDMRSRRRRVSGVLVVGMADRIARNCIMPELGPFLARHPDLQVDVRRVHATNEAVASEVDVLLILSWQHYEDWMSRDIAQTRLLTCASPAYWREHGMPNDPDELRSHTTLVYRSSHGIVLDTAKYQRGNMVKSITLKPRVICDDYDARLAAAIQGCGVIVASDLTMWPLISQGVLVPALRDWRMLEAP